MRFTRRLLDHRAVVAPLFVGCLLSAALLTNCASDDEPAASTDGIDGGSDASRDASSAVVDSGDADATADSALPWFDGGAAPVVCSTPPCATALVTTTARDKNDYGEGYCALLDDGTVACWGANGAAQLGRGDAVTMDSATPTRVPGLNDVVRLAHTCAIDKNGKASCWGTGPFLRDGSGARTTEASPIELPFDSVKTIGIGEEVGCVLLADGVTCWGKNSNAQLSPLSTDPASKVLGPKPITLPSGAPVRELFVGRATVVVRDDGSTASWGADPPLARVSSLSPDPYPRPMALASVTSLDLTRESGCAAVGGIGYCWGTLIGGNTPFDHAMPTPVVAPEPLVDISTTIAQSRMESEVTTIRPQRWCAVGASGAVYCWGLNTSGQAGDGTKDTAYSAVKVSGLPAPAARIKAMPDSTCALLTNGKVHCWGANYYGQLGNGKLRVPSLVPQEVVLP
ncbi:hypothetical protein AKJ09_00504 [Labilithrix luteola]|uniref:BNR repeat domain protein n=1 Tax=Labilithrix luteola TaxID=1391654 RepID=A0A0K1PJY8_9BACT|nr:hypothetical protein [Labilithrix luteola]AKU93840.1 hypothetical protein AKJ09_00504 [Labilithrix luteola]